LGWIPYSSHTAQRGNTGDLQFGVQPVGVIPLGLGGVLVEVGGLVDALGGYPEKMGQPSIKVTIPGRAGCNSTITARAATMTTKQIANPPHRSR
jgi:hypothetical protein